jgi:thiol:disulfide interchange protein DsbD
VLATDEVRRAVADRGVALLKADWTLRDDAISAMLRRYRKAGVPMYLVYSPARPDAPEILPEVLIPSRVIAAIEAATSK